MLHFNIVTLFPEFFSAPLDTGLMGRALKAGLISFSFHNPRDFSQDRHRHVDDRPFGGGPGMVMLLDPLKKTLDAIPCPGPLLLMSPAGARFNQEMAGNLSCQESITIICGRYEGIDQRLQDLLPIEPVSVCDAVLNGGETGALVVVEAVARLLPNFMGDQESIEEESFSHGLLEYPHYTRPEIYEGRSAPGVLLSGDHGRIASWRHERALGNTLANRPDLLDTAKLSREDARILSNLPRLRLGRNISFCLMHHPVLVDGQENGITSLTNLDIHDIARISRSYGMGPFYIYTPLADQLEVLRQITLHWARQGVYKEDRKKALGLVRPVASIQELEEECQTFYGREPVFLVASAKWSDADCMTIGEVKSLARETPIIICLGTGRGLDLRKLPFKFRLVRPLRFLDENHLSVRSAAAILADRIIGDYN